MVALSAQANITTLPATWADLRDAVRALKSAGVTPTALAGGTSRGRRGAQESRADKDFSGEEFARPASTEAVSFVVVTPSDESDLLPVS